MGNIFVSSIYFRGKYIISHEGWTSLLKQMFSHIKNLVYCHGTYLISELDLTSSKETICRPRIECTFKSISNASELEGLIAQGYDLKVYDFQQKLAKGALAFCIFVDKNLASVAWVAPNEEAKMLIDEVPFKVNYDKGEMCVGAVFTAPAYRGKGLMPYTHTMIFSYLANKHVVKLKASERVTNIASHRAASKLKAKNPAKGRYLKILWWHSWKEEPIKEETL